MGGVDDPLGEQDHDGELAVVGDVALGIAEGSGADAEEEGGEEREGWGEAEGVGDEAEADDGFEEADEGGIGHPADGEDFGEAVGFGDFCVAGAEFPVDGHEVDDEGEEEAHDEGFVGVPGHGAEPEEFAEFVHGAAGVRGLAPMKTCSLLKLEPSMVMLMSQTLREEAGYLARLEASSFSISRARKRSAASWR